MRMRRRFRRARARRRRFDVSFVNMVCIGGKRCMGVRCMLMLNGLDVDVCGRCCEGRVCLSSRATSDATERAFRLSMTRGNEWWMGLIMLCFLIVCV